MFTADERDLLFKILNDVKILPLDPNSLPLLQAIQAIAKKIYAASEPQKPSSSEKVSSDF